MKLLKESLSEKLFINPRNQEWFKQAIIDIEKDREKFKEGFDKELNEKGKIDGIHKVTSGKFKGCSFSYPLEEADSKDYNGKDIKTKVTREKAQRMRNKKKKDDESKSLFTKEDFTVFA